MSDQDTDRSPSKDSPPLPATVVGEIKPTPVVAHNVWVGISGGHLILAHFFAGSLCSPPGGGSDAHGRREDRHAGPRRPTRRP